MINGVRTVTAGKEISRGSLIWRQALCFMLLAPFMLHSIHMQQPQPHGVCEGATPTGATGWHVYAELEAEGPWQTHRWRVFVSMEGLPRAGYVVLPFGTLCPWAKRQHDRSGTGQPCNADRAAELLCT